MTDRVDVAMGALNGTLKNRLAGVKKLKPKTSGKSFGMLNSIKNDTCKTFLVVGCIPQKHKCIPLKGV